MWWTVGSAYNKGYKTSAKRFRQHWLSATKNDDSQILCNKQL